MKGGIQIEKGLAYIISLIITSLTLFFVIVSWLKTDNPAIVFFLAMIVGDKILEKTKIVEVLEKVISDKPNL